MKKEKEDIFETDTKLHGNVKNTNKFCVGCILVKNCLIGRMAAVAYCKDYKGE